MHYKNMKSKSNYKLTKKYILFKTLINKKDVLIFAKKLKILIKVDFWLKRKFFI